MSLAFLLLAACSSADDGTIEGSEAIDCRLPGASNFEMVCTVDKMKTPDGLVLTVRAPDGGFHRLLVVRDGSGVVAADGAEPVVVRPSGEFTIDVTAGEMVYRLPAKIAP